MHTPDLFGCPPPAKALGARQPGGQAPHFYRCPECLTTFTTTEKLGAWGSRHAGKCACGSEIVEWLGQSAVDRLLKVENLCACDFRCTEARGPNCTCKCGGANHGSGLMIEVTRDCGPIPVLKMKSPELCQLQASQWKQAQLDALGRMEAKHGEQYRRKKAGVWIDREFFDAIHADEKLLKAARNLTTHKGRMEKIAKVAK